MAMFPKIYTTVAPVCEQYINSVYRERLIDDTLMPRSIASVAHSSTRSLEKRLRYQLCLFMNCLIALLHFTCALDWSCWRLNCSIKPALSSDCLSIAQHKTSIVVRLLVDRSAQKPVLSSNCLSIAQHKNSIVVRLFVDRSAQFQSTPSGKLIIR